MTINFKSIIPERYLKLELFDGRNKEIKFISELDIRSKITFNTTATVSGAIQEANIVIYGLTVEKMIYLATSCTPWTKNNIFNTINIYGGYFNKYGLLFSGNIIEAIPNFDNANYNITLKCNSGFNNMLNTIVNYSFKGTTNLITILQQIANKLGFCLINNLKQTSILQHIRNLAEITNTDIYIENQYLIVKTKGINIENSSYKTLKVDKLNLIGNIKITAIGCNLSIKLNPYLISGQAVLIDSVKYPQLKNNTFVIQTIAHEGDTKGVNWKSNLVLIKQDLYNS